MSDGGDKEAQICGGRMREWATPANVSLHYTV